MPNNAKKDVVNPNRSSIPELKIKTGLSTWVGRRRHAGCGIPDRLVPCHILWRHVHSGMLELLDYSCIRVWGIAYMTPFYDDGRRI